MLKLRGLISFLFLFLPLNFGIDGVFLPSALDVPVIEGITEWSGRDGFGTFGSKKLLSVVYCFNCLMTSNFSL